MTTASQTASQTASHTSPHDPIDLKRKMVDEYRSPYECESFPRCEHYACEYVLDLHDATGEGYRFMYDRLRQTASLRLFSDWEEAFVGVFDIEDVVRFEYMLTTASSVARAVGDDAILGFIRECFGDGWAEVPELGVKMLFDLADENNNEIVECYLWVDVPGTDDEIASVSFELTQSELEAATRDVHRLVCHG